jgi:protein phosphatase methylesterase 1
MSELQRRWAKAKLDAQVGNSSGRRLDEEDEEDEEGDGRASLDDDSASSASSASSTGTIVPSASQNLFARPQGLSRTRGGSPGGSGGGRTLEPIPWTAFFERELFLDADDGSAIVHHAYVTSPTGSGPLFVMHHGAGSSGLSFAVVGAEIRKRLPSAGILSLDARDHGLTKAPADLGNDLSLGTLSSDLFTVIRLAQAQMHWPELPPLVLVGHSLGGAVVTDLAFSGRLNTTPTSSPLLGFAVLDVVEGSAMDALQSMQTYLGTRPPGFPTLENGIEWHIRSRTIRNVTSARTSVPALLVNNSSDSQDEGDKDTSSTSISEGSAPPPPSPTSAADKSGAKRRPWRWRTDLGATQPFWEGWFVGLSKKFLGARGGKLLLLAGTDRLDTELTIGQMQGKYCIPSFFSYLVSRDMLTHLGKYALQVFPEAGHFIHEDLPEKTALTLVDFYHRNNRGALVLPPKVSELLAQGKKV